MAEEIKTLTPEEQAQKEVEESGLTGGEGGEGGKEPEHKEHPAETPEQEISRLKTELSKANGWNAKSRLEQKRLADRLAALEEKGKSEEPPDYEKDLDSIGDEDFVPGAPIKTILRKLEKSVRERTLKEVQEFIPTLKRELRAEASLERAMEKHDGSDGLPSMEEMRDILKDKLTEEEAMEITESRDPAETAYKIGLKHYKGDNGATGSEGAGRKKPPTKIPGSAGGGRSLTEADIASKVANWDKLKPEEQAEIRRLTSL